MAYDLEYRDAGFYLTHKGDVSIGEINEVNGKIHESEHFDDHKFQLINLLEANFSEVNESHGRMPGSTDAVASIRNEDVRVALVTKDDATIRFCEEYVETAKSMGSTWDFKIFPDVDAAEEWVKG